MSNVKVPYITFERSNNTAEINTDLIVAHKNSLIMISMVDSPQLLKRFFSNIMQGKGYIDIKDRSNIHFTQPIFLHEDDKFEYKISKHDNESSHGVAYNEKYKEYVFDWDGEGESVVIARYLSTQKYLPVTEEIVAEVLSMDGHNTVVEPCSVYTTQDELSHIKVWHVDTDAFVHTLEQIDMQEDDFDWDEVEDIADYTVTFVKPIKNKLNDSIEVLYNEKNISEKMFEGLKPYDGQVPLIQGGVEALKRKDNRFIYLAARQGCGKTVMSIKMNHTYHDDIDKNNYISMIVAPSITLTQWKDELLATIADDIDIVTINTTDEFIRYYNQTNMVVDKPTYILVGKETFKLSYDLKHAIIPENQIVNGQQREVCLCPDCWKPVYNKLRTTEMVYFTEEDFDKPRKSNYKCPHCSSVLFQAHYEKTKKTSVANFVRKRNIRFDSVIIDEIHESNNFDSIIGKATRDIVKQAKKSILLSGTISNGYASSVYNILFALIPNTLKKEGVFSKDEFVKAYGTLQGSRKIQDDERHKSDQLEVTESSMVEIEGINPLVYTKFFAENFIFAELEDIRTDLPELNEYYVPVKMLDEVVQNEKRLYEGIKAVNPLNAAFYKDSVVKHYINNPFHWNSIPIDVDKETGEIKQSVQPVNIEQQLLPKEHEND